MGNYIDLTGKRFGRWTVLERDYDSQKKNIYWKCRCDCGTERSVAGTSLRSGISVSCGCEKDEKTSVRTKTRVQDITGQRFGLWTVLRQDLSNNGASKRGSRWICKCDCGNEKSVLGYALWFGRSKSCGCINGENKIIDLTGQRFGKLLVIERDYETPNTGRGARWKCQCDCGNTISVLSGRLRSGQTSSCGCARLLNATNQKTEDIVGKRFGSWVVLRKDTTQKWNKTFYICKCDCGTVRSISGYSLRKGFSKSCGCSKSVPKEDLSGKRFGNLTVIGLDESNNNHGINWICKCDCGNIITTREYHLIHGAVRSCGCLSSSMTSARRFNDITGQRFGRLVALSVDHKQKDNNGNYSYYWLCKCDCGNESVVQADVLRRGDVKSCGCLQAEESAKRAKERLIDITGKRYGLLTVIERVELDESGFGFGKWKCKCDCGNYKLVDGYYLRRGMISSCGCSNQSKLEIYVLQYFDEKGYISAVDYDYQKRFEDLRGYGEGMLSYDFAFYNNHELRYLIECQGEQHYVPVGIFGGEEQFAKQQLHDTIKKNYAIQLGIPLIEIPYYAETYEKVKEILEGYGI